MEYHFTNVGQAICTDKEYIKGRYNALDWIELKPSKTSLPFSQGTAIQETINEFKIPKVSHVAVHGNIDNLGFYGIRGHYKNGTYDICIVDDGLCIIPLLTVKQ